jgi:lipopolysaccharide export system protein LptA
VNKYVLSLLFLLSAAVVFGQSKSRVNLVSSTTAEAAPGPNGTRIIKVHNGVFKQDYSTLTSDSAYFYADQNMVDAFGHVVINQGDTVHIYADKLNYNGNTKTALLTNHVIMVDKDATLTTDYFTYNTATRIGTYTDGGKLVNKDNTVVSKNGYYFAFTRDAYFRYDVVCNTPDAVIKTDTMRYNSAIGSPIFMGQPLLRVKTRTTCIQKTVLTIQQPNRLSSAKKIFIPKKPKP